MQVQVKPFVIDIPEAVLDDLRARLARTRWPDALPGTGWERGADPAFMRALVDRWRDGFDWRAQEARINTFANYRANIDGSGVHFIHSRGRGPAPMPLLITHGWPSSFYEMLELIPLLTDPAGHGGDPADAFDVVVPSIPGYAFSDRPAERRFDYWNVADLWVKLMAGLGYPRFGAHSYDVGGSIMARLAFSHPERLIGYHTTEPGNPSPAIGPDTPDLSDAEREYLAVQRRWQADEGGYMAIQGTRPQTPAYGLADSPAGLAAWIVEKWYAWTEPPGGDLTRHFTLDQLLTNITIFWVTETIASANRYYDRRDSRGAVPPEARIDVPLGVALTTQAIERAPREYVARRYPDIRHWVDLGRGGHFIALEEPALLAESIRAFFRPLR